MGFPLGFVLVSSRVSFVPPKVVTWENLMYCLVKLVANVHVKSGGTVMQFLLLTSVN